MKISKLFHWLYAFLMLLPVFFVGGRVAYTIFNKNAYESYSQKQVANQTLLSSTASLGENLNYKIKFTRYNNVFSGQNSARVYYTDIDIDWTAYGAPSGYNYDAFQTYKTPHGNPFFYLYLYVNNTNVYTFWNVENLLNLEFDITITSNITLNGNEVFYVYNNFTENQTLDNAFTYSMNEINENVLFSWAKTSFLVTPFSYIGNLFGVPSTSPIITLLSYWLSISIIWLVFDLVMYVPLLVHRWIDKGIVE